jgi:DNA-binding phage protein
MALTRDFKQTVVERVQRDPQFAHALFDEALTLMLTGEPETARMMLRDLINSTVGFETLAERTDKPAKSLHRMFSARGNPSMDNLTAVVGSLRDWLHLSVEVRSKRVAAARKNPATAVARTRPKRSAASAGARSRKPARARSA